jgi:type I restriction enzyme, S subunit
MDGEEQKLVTPRLRFPEFREEWETKPLADVARPVTERAGAKSITPLTVTTGVGLVSQESRYGRTIAGNAIKNYFVLEKNDFAYNKSSTRAFPQGYIARFKGDGQGAVPNSIFTCFRAEIAKVDPAYLDFLFAGNLHGRWLQNYIMVGARANGALNVSDSDLMALPIPLPRGPKSLVEQKKIADCLTSLDEVIAAQGRKVAALKAHKRGLMQQLFPREGETVPRLRFPQFRDAPEWVYEKIEGFAKITTGNKDTQHKVEDGQYPFFVRSQSVQRINSYSFDTEAILTSGDGVGVGEDYHYVDGKFDFHQRVYCIYEFRKDVSGKFFYMYFAEHFGPRVRQMSAKNSVDSVRRAMIAEMPVALPRLDEQERIAADLSTLDEVTAAESHQFVSLKTYRQGLLHRLFPKLEGIK